MIGYRVICDAEAKELRPNLLINHKCFHFHCVILSQSIRLNQPDNATKILSFVIEVSKVEWLLDMTLFKVNDRINKKLAKERFLSLL